MMFKRTLILAALASLALLPSARAADVSAPAAITKALAAPSTCIAGDCSGWYAGFGLLGDGSNVDIIGNGVNGSVFSSGGAMKVQAGYQLWKGAWFAAAEIGAGYEFTTASSAGIVSPNKGGSRFLGTELVKLGYNFFPSSAAALTTPSQSPIPLTVPASLLSSSTPYLVFGGLQRRGVSEWVSGAGVQFIPAAGWSTDVKYLYAPAQQNVAATSIVMFEVNRHF